MIFTYYQFWVGLFLGGLVVFIGMAVLSMSREEPLPIDDDIERWAEIKKGLSHE